MVILSIKPSCVKEKSRSMLMMETKNLPFVFAKQEISLCYRAYRPAVLKYTTPIVMVHGLTRQKMDFDYVAKALAEAGFYVMSFDMPGRGGSSWLARAEDYAVDFYAAMMIKALDLLHFKAVHWVGTSMGGLIALQMGLLGGQAWFASLTLVDITPAPAFDACVRIANYLSESLPILPAVEDYIAFIKKNLPLGQVTDEVWYHFAVHQLREKKDGYHFHFDPKIVPLAKKGLSEKIDLTVALDFLNCSLALIAGGQSDLCTAHEINALKILRPKLALLIDEAAGHIPALADEASHSFMRDFLVEAERLRS
jgi:pimeloyl-ACP methyl ester carboxylesterase